ncbi:hypothetical protein [Nereida sp. MMG025]|uniref:hypothetical protein n=1 Tax=Nereida sp. MMG025 TaxID=2909981 RepID=UPI001F1E6E69|nr:hypothetical protein [Nereida sp. MMG025]MCF6445930.1 hypothetical protein [Nereida sp. MMG025]
MTLIDPKKADIACVFMVEPGHYEWPAVLLASSLMAFALDDIAIHAYCRGHLIDQLHPDTLAFFQRHGIQLDPIHPEFEVPYPQGNKLYACAASRPAPATILFDTDMFMLRPAFLGDTVRKGTVSGRPTGDWMWGKSVDEWRAAYASVDMDLPRLRLARPSGSYVSPSMSAGFTAYADPDFGGVWRDTALRIEEKRLAKRIYPTLDQISLPVAIHRACLKMNMIDVIWNKAGPIKPQALRNVVCYHYQKSETLLGLSIKWLADELLRDFSDFDTVEELIAFYEEHAARPADVLHNEGFRDAVLAEQRKVDEPHKAK